MKTLIVVSTLTTLVLVTAAAQAAPIVNCKKDTDGYVTVTQKGGKATLNRASAVKLAYTTCLSNESAVKAARTKVLAEATRAVHQDDSSAGCEVRKGTVVQESSWNGERPYQNKLGGSEGYLMIEPMECGSVGSGVFSGITANFIARLSTDWSAEFHDMDGDNENYVSQQVRVKYDGAAQIK